jgi:hypothetical protein
MNQRPKLTDPKRWQRTLQKQQESIVSIHKVKQHNTKEEL